jgi:phosphocarrier protein
MHARPAAQFVRCAARFGCEIYVSRDGIEINGKSIMGVMMLAAGQGTRVLVEAKGDDAEAAIAAVEKLIAERFGESE